MVLFSSTGIAYWFIIPWKNPEHWKIVQANGAFSSTFATFTFRSNSGMELLLEAPKTEKKINFLILATFAASIRTHF